MTVGEALSNPTIIAFIGVVAFAAFVLGGVVGIRAERSRAEADKEGDQ